MRKHRLNTAKYCILPIYWGLVGGYAQLMQCVPKDDGTVGVVKAQTDSRTWMPYRNRMPLQCFIASPQLTPPQYWFGQLPEGQRSHNRVSKIRVTQFQNRVQQQQTRFLQQDLQEVLVAGGQGYVPVNDSAAISFPGTDSQRALFCGLAQRPCT